MKYSYNMFHLSKDDYRDANVQAMHQYMLEYAELIGSPTVNFESVADINDFCKSNLDFALDFSGYNPKDLSRNLLLRTLPTLKGWKLGEVGIWASNFLAWKAFLETDSDYLILMEDDAIFSPDFMPTLVSYMTELPDDWDMYHHFVHDQDAGWYSNKLDVGAPNVCRVYQEWSNLCYVINRGSAQKLLDLVKEGVDLPLDWFWSKQTEKIVSYTLKPNIYSGIRLDGSASTFQTNNKRLDLSQLNKDLPGSR